jgi:hypothetical protein
MAVCAGYAAYPYVTLYRLGDAIGSGDAQTLQHLVDWPSVREGIKEDICDQVLDQPTAVKAGKDLAPFGASFMRGMAASAVDQAVTPEGLVAAVQAPAEPHPRSRHGADVGVAWAFFSGLSTFNVSLRVPGETHPVRLEMELRHARWQVHRVWLPDDLLQQANART